MHIGLSGVGVVGGTLKKYFEKNTKHTLVCYDPAKDMRDSFDGVEAVFISVPVFPTRDRQDLGMLTAAVDRAKQFTKNIFVRSTVLPGTNDMLGTTAMPEFLTERRAYEDMCHLPILVGNAHKDFRVDKVFPHKEIIHVSNKEAELTKFTHNCFGAMKVTYFNIINEICAKIGADYEVVRRASMLTGFIEETHTQVPGHDGMFGYGGSCFPGNIRAMTAYLRSEKFVDREYMRDFFEAIHSANYRYRMITPLRTIKNKEKEVNA